MVETTITDIIRGTITTDNPLRTFYEVVTEFCNLLAYIAITLFNFREDSISQSTRLFGIIFFLDPLFKELFQLIGAARARLSFSHQFHEAGTHFFISDSHTEAKFAEIFEEGVCPSRTLTFFVNCIRSRRHRSGINRRATGSVRHHLAVAEQLSNQFNIRCFATAGASAGEFEERSSELRIFHISLNIDKILF